MLRVDGGNLSLARPSRALIGHFMLASVRGKSTGTMPRATRLAKSLLIALGCDS
jgi:hypothetical protein